LFFHSWMDILIPPIYILDPTYWYEYVCSSHLKPMVFWLLNGQCWIKAINQEIPCQFFHSTSQPKLHRMCFIRLSWDRGDPILLLLLLQSMLAK
jgi:hypothetical protein